MECEVPVGETLSIAEIRERLGWCRQWDRLTLELQASLVTVLDAHDAIQEENKKLKQLLSNKASTQEEADDRIPRHIVVEVLARRFAELQKQCIDKQISHELARARINETQTIRERLDIPIDEYDAALRIWCASTTSTKAAK